MKGSVNMKVNKKIMFILGISVFFIGVFGISANYLYSAKDIAYGESNVADEIDNLYKLSKSDIETTKISKAVPTSWSTDNIEIEKDGTYYLKITAQTKNFISFMIRLVRDGESIPIDGVTKNADTTYSMIISAQAIIDVKEGDRISYMTASNSTFNIDLYITQGYLH